MGRDGPREPDREMRLETWKTVDSLVPPFRGVTALVPQPHFDPMADSDSRAGAPSTDHVLLVVERTEGHAGVLEGKDPATRPVSEGAATERWAGPVVELQRQGGWVDVVGGGRREWNRCRFRT